MMEREGLLTGDWRYVFLGGATRIWPYLSVWVWVPFDECVFRDTGARAQFDQASNDLRWWMCASWNRVVEVKVWERLGRVCTRETNWGRGTGSRSQGMTIAVPRPEAARHLGRSYIAKYSRVEKTSLSEELLYFTSQRLLHWRSECARNEEKKMRNSLLLSFTPFSLGQPKDCFPELLIQLQMFCDGCFSCREKSCLSKVCW